MSSISETVMIAAGTGLVSTLTTVVSLRIHILYLKEAIAGLSKRLNHVEQAAQTANARLDMIELEKKFKNEHL